MSITEWAFYVAALPRLDALHAMRDSEASALPWLSPADRRRTWKRWQQLAFGDAAGRHQSAALVPDGMAVRQQASTSVAALDTI